MGRCREPRDIDRMGLRSDLESNLARIEASGRNADEVLNELADSMV